MKSILVFIPNILHEEKSGYMYGKITHDENTHTTKFYIIGIKQTSTMELSKLGIDVIGFYSGTEHKCGYSDKKYSDWLCVCTQRSSPSKSDNYDYIIKSIIINSIKILPPQYHTVIVIYNQLALRQTELFLDAATSENHFYELAKMLQLKQVDRELTKKSQLANIEETLLIYHMFLYFYPILLLSKITNKLLPILKYSSLGLHVDGWLENVKWMLRNVIENKRFTLKTGNHACTLLIDMLMGVLLLQLLLHCLEGISPSQILLSNAEKVVEALYDLIHWLMGAPAGLKLNYALNHMIGKCCLYHIYLWRTFLILIKPFMDFAFKILLLFGRLGLTFQIAIAADLLALVSFHTYCIYVYVARLFNIQLKGITALFRLFLGKKKNPLRERVDSCQYQPDQLFVGTLLFTILLFLMPTTWVYYTVFSMLRLASISFGGFLARLKFYLQVMPTYTFTKWIFGSYRTCSTVHTKLCSHGSEGPIRLAMTLIATSWSRTWEKCIPDTIVRHAPIEWNKILGNIVWGELLYPL